MVLLATLAAALAATQPAPTAATQRQARATVTILKAARIRMGEPGTERPDAGVRRTMIRDEDDPPRQALLIEFP